MVPPYDPPVDHFQCYGIRKAEGFEKQTVSVVDQFENPKEIELVKPTHLCNPTDKIREGIINESQHLVCYKVRTENDRIKRDVYTNNQFGPLEGHTKKETELCVPSQKQIASEQSQ